jgi:hypothetical protein
MLDGAANVAGLLVRTRSDTREIVNVMKYEITNEQWKPHEIDEEDIEHIMMTMDNDGFKSVYTFPKPSVRAFQTIAAAMNWCDSGGIKLPIVDGYNAVMSDTSPGYSIRGNLVKFYNLRADSTLSRHTVIVIFSSTHAYVAYRNIRFIEHLPRGTVIPVYGRMNTYDEARQAKYTTSSDVIYPRIIGCNKLDCPFKRKGEWWAIDADPHRMFRSLLYTGEDVKINQVLPGTFVRKYKKLCRSISDSLTAEVVKSTFDMHKYKLETKKVADITEEIRKTVCKKRHLYNLLKSSGKAVDRKQLSRLCHTFQFHQRRFLRRELNRFMMTTFIPYSTDSPNAMFVSHLFWTEHGHQLQAYIILTKSLSPGSEIRLHYNTIDQIQA